MAKVFITGASGFVGSHLVEDVKKLGWEIHAAVRQSIGVGCVTNIARCKLLAFLCYVCR